MQRIWLVLAEIIAENDKSAGSKIGFMNITTWAESKDAARLKIENYLNSLGWHLVLIDKADLVNEESQYGDEVTDMIDRTRGNPNAIILGTFHTYKAN